MNISGADIVMCTVVISFFGYEIYRLRCIREVARLYAEEEKRKAAETNDVKKLD